MFYQEDNFVNGFIELMKKCNSKILDIYNDEFFHVTYKEDESPLTMADKVCNDIICNHLNALNFHRDLNIGIVSEENKNEHFMVRKNYKYVWLVDPLDGTKEFVKKNGQFTVNVGLVDNGVPVFGVVSIPVTGEIYVGIKGKGSYKIHNNIKTTLKIKKKNFKKKHLNIVASASHINKETKEFIAQFDEPNIVSTGSSIKLLLVAENKADVYPRIAPTSEWDTCAAHAVVKYAGGNVVIHNETKLFNTITNEVKYNKENILNPYFVVF